VAKLNDRPNDRAGNAVPAIVPPSSALAASPSPISTHQTVRQQDQSRATLPISHYLWLMRTHAGKMLVFVALVLMATAFVSIRMKPIYESTATLYVDHAAAKNVVGQDSQSTANSTADADAFLWSQIKLLQSDAVVRPLAEKYKLLEREGQIHPGSDDRVRLAKTGNAPIVLKGLRITRPPNTYILQISYRSDDPEVATAVANGIADSYIQHTYDIRFSSSKNLSKFMARQLDELRARMEGSSARLAALEQELAVINPEEKTSILSSRLLQINTEYTKIQGERVRAESVYNSLTAGSLEAALTSSQSEDLRKTLQRLNEAKEHFADIKARYGSNHPEYTRMEATVTELQDQVDTTVKQLTKQAATEFQRAQNQEALLEKDLAATKLDYDHLNLRSFEYQRAKEEATADRTLYEELVKRIREDEINSGFQNDMVRVADLARPAVRPVSPNIPLNLLLAFLVSSMLAIAGVIVVDRVDTTVRNPEQVVRGLRTRVVGSLPVIKKMSGSRTLGGLAAPRELIPNGNGDNQSTVSTVTPFEEAVRSVRNAVLLTDFDRRLRSILLTSASPSEGKSTVAAHFALSNAEQSRRTLLIDGDMRRPSLHKLFQIPNSVGLSRVLDREIPWREVLIQPRPDLELYILPAGPATKRASSIVGQALPQLLEEAAEDFDLIILDAPPLLGFPEPLEMAAAVDGVIVVARAGQTDRSAVAAVLDTLNDLRANVLGLVLNEVRKETSSSYYYYDSYSKYYGKRRAMDRRHSA
jgi:capsular exopolysaccharide synthesis family protein